MNQIKLVKLVHTNEKKLKKEVLNWMKYGKILFKELKLTQAIIKLHVKEWVRGKPSTLKAHLANNCAPCPENISKYWQDKLANNNNNYTRNLKNPPSKLVI